MILPHNMDVMLETPFGTLEDVPAEFEIHINRYPAEPYSWGEPRGYDTEVAANLQTIQLGHLVMDVHSAIKAFGHEAIRAAEEYAENHYVL